MKFTKLFAILFAFATLTFTVTSCSSDDDENTENNGGKVEEGVSELKDNGSVISYTYWESYAGIKMSVTLYFGYDKASGKVTSMKAEYESSNSQVIDAVYEEMKDDKDYASVTKSGNKLTCVSKPEMYADMTTEQVRYGYEVLKKTRK